MMTIQNKYHLGGFVYLITDPEQGKRMVIEIRVTLAGLIYTVSAGTEISDHYEYELTNEEDLLTKLKG